MTRYLWVAIGSALGGMARYFLTGVVQRAAGGTFPFGTLAVNLIGCFVIGAFMAWFGPRADAAPGLRAFVVVGVLGGFTTFSAFGFESSALARSGAVGLAFWNVLAHIGLGLGAVALGRAVVLAVGL